MSQVLITGGAGMIGRRLAERLSDEHEVVIYDSFERSSASYEVLSGEFNCIKGDILDTDRLTTAMRDSDAVFHLAAYGSVLESIVDPRSNFNANVLGTLSVLDAMRVTGVPKIVFSSTGGALMGNTPPRQLVKTLCLRQSRPMGPRSYVARVICVLTGRRMGLAQ